MEGGASVDAAAAASEPTAAELAEAHNGAANAVLAAGFLGDAIEAYTRAINQGGGLPRLGVYYANRAQARLKLEEHELAAYDAAFALSLDPSLWKARLRLMRALHAMGRTDDAASAARALLESSPPAAAAQEASSLLRQQQPAAADAIERLVLSRSMTLRLHVGGPALLGLRRGGWHAVTLRLSNEMGLFDRRWAASTAVRLRVLPLRPAQLPEAAADAAAEAASAALELRQLGGGGSGGGGGGASDEACGGGGGGGGVVVRLERGRAVAEVRLDAAAAPGCEQAVLWAQSIADGAGGAGGSGDAATRVVLDFLSPPLPLWTAPLGTAGGARDGQKGRGGDGGNDRDGDGSAAASSVLARLLPALGAGQAELPSCFRLVATNAGGGGGGGGGGSSQLLLLAEASAAICGRVWDSALALVRWLEVEAAEAMRGGARVIELGSGCGVGGLGAAALGAAVLLTDLAEALPLLRLNARLNAPLCAGAKPPAVAALDWGGDAAAVARAVGALPPPPPAVEGAEAAEAVEAAVGGAEWVVSSDVVYEPTAYDPLLATLRALAAVGGAEAARPPRIIMAHRSRNPDEHLFFGAAAEHFEMTVVQGPALRPLGAPADAPSIPARHADREAAAAEDDPATVRIVEFVAREVIV